MRELRPVVVTERTGLIRSAPAAKFQPAREILEPTMATVGLGPGQAIRVFDHSPNPRTALNLLGAVIGEFISAAWFPVTHVRRGWLHGPHIVITVRPAAEHSANRAHDLTGLAASIGERVAELPADEPDPERYLALAEQLGRWENVAGPYLPLRPHGFVQVGPAESAQTLGPPLELARDLMLARLLTPMLRAADAAQDRIAGYAMRLLALAAQSHPGGIELGTLPYRSHAEAILTFTGGTADLRATFDARLAVDNAEFDQALADPIGSAPDHHQDSLRLWSGALAGCWGIAEALILSGAIDRRALDEAGRLRTLPVRGGLPSPFHEQMRVLNFRAEQPFWHLAHRLVVNVLYQSLTGLGLSALQRYYLCHGLSEATDRALHQSWSQRLVQYAWRPAGAAAGTRG
jgi:hypothetical protein